MATYYVDPTLADGTVNAGTSGNPTSLRDALTSKAAANDLVYIEQGSGTLLNANGAISCAVNQITVEAFQSTPGDQAVTGALATFSPDTGSFTALQMGSFNQTYRGLKLDGFDIGVNADSNSGLLLEDFHLYNCATAGFTKTGSDSGPILLVRCLANGCGTGFDITARAVHLFRSLGIDCTSGFVLDNTLGVMTAAECIAHKCSGIGFQIERVTSLLRCHANECATGVEIIDSRAAQLLANCAITHNTTGLASAGSESIRQINCCFFGNGTDKDGVSGEVTGEVTEDPGFTAPDPVDPMDVDLRYGGGGSLVAAGVGWPSEFTAMG